MLCTLPLVTYTVSLVQQSSHRYHEVKYSDTMSERCCQATQEYSDPAAENFTLISDPGCATVSATIIVVLQPLVVVAVWVPLVTS